MRMLRLVMVATLAMVAALAGTGTARAEVDVYTTAGQHTVNGRLWRTDCEMYSSSVERCRTEIWAYTVALEDGRYREKAGWAFNNLTYKKSPRAAWEVWNPLVTPGVHEIDGRMWKTECDTTWTGSNACRSQIYATIIEKTASGFRSVNKYVFNNIVHLRPVNCPVSQSAVRTGTKVAGAVIQGCERSAKDATWVAVDFAVTGEGDEAYLSTALLRQGGSGWVYRAHSGTNRVPFCDWAATMNVPSDLRDHFPYCTA